MTNFRIICLILCQKIVQNCSNIDQIVRIFELKSKCSNIRLFEYSFTIPTEKDFNRTGQFGKKVSPIQPFTEPNTELSYCLKFTFNFGLNFLQIFIRKFFSWVMIIERYQIRNNTILFKLLKLWTHFLFQICLFCKLLGQFCMNLELYKFGKVSPNRFGRTWSSVGH